MAVLVGIDEAGYGPLLGPLMVSACAFQLPDELLRKDMWSILSKSVSNSKLKLAGRLLITDSKKAYSKSSGIGHLEKTILASLQTLEKKPSTLLQFIDHACPECLPRLERYPWYSDLALVNLDGHLDSVSISAGAFAKNLDSNQIKLILLKSKCFDVRYYNDLVDKTNNKASVLLSAVSSFIKETYDNFGDQGLQIVVDRQGGRVDYTGKLRLMFADTELTVIRQDEKISSYQLDGKGRSMRIHFAVKADAKWLPVSLASMMSKYFRELLIARINNFFVSQFPDLKPTAGYWQDGQRFVSDLQKRGYDISTSDKMLIRSR